MAHLKKHSYRDIFSFGPYLQYNYLQNGFEPELFKLYEKLF